MSVVGVFEYGTSLKVERVEPGRNGRRKEFFPYHRTEAGEWKIGTNGTPFPWYHADELAEAIADGQRVFLGEGEGKIDRLRVASRAKGSRAAFTSLQGGCKAPLREEHLLAIAGAKQIVLLADSDEPGRDSAKARVQAILRCHPEMDVRIIDLYPNRNDGSDIADWLDEGHTLKEFRALLDAAPRSVPVLEANPRKAPLSNGVPSANLLDLRDVRFERVRWFENNMIPRAEFTLVNGDGGIGKTTLILDLIARASSGRRMPSGLLHGEPLRCLIIAEEDRHGLLRARLDVAGADFDNIRLMESVGEQREFAVFPTHTQTLLRTITEGRFDFAMIDAFLNHFADDLNSSKPQDMRKVARPLSDVAHETGATIIAIRHFGKAAGSASTRGLGSIEARNVCRSELAVAPHPDEDAHPGLFVVALSKTNLAEDRTATLAYRLAPVDVTDDDGHPTTIARVEWEASPPAITADELTNRPEEGERSKIDAAADWLRDHLGSSEYRALDVCEAGRKAGHSQPTLYRARKKAGVTTEQRGYPAKAYWFIKDPLVSHVFSIGETDKADKPGAVGVDDSEMVEAEI